MYTEAKYHETDELIGKVLGLADLFPREQYEQQKIFLLTAIKWSASTRSSACGGVGSAKGTVAYPGHPLLFRTLARREVELGLLLPAEDHFIKGMDDAFLEAIYRLFIISLMAVGGAADLLETHIKSLLPQMDENEIDLFVTRSILKFLCLGDLKNANLLMNGFKEVCGVNPQMHLSHGFLRLTRRFYLKSENHLLSPILHVFFS
jgi:hypothetical protein